MVIAPTATLDHEEYRSYVREFAEREIAPHTKRWDQGNGLPWDAIKKMGEAGCLGVIGAPELGGQGKDYVSLGITIEELARADISCAIICWVESTLSTLVPGWGDQTIRAVHQGDQIVALATSEVNAGSDVSAMECEAQLEGDQYVINGTKVHVSMMPGAQVMGVTARTIVNREYKGITMFRVPTDLPGITCSLMDQLGVRAHQLGRVILKDVRVPSSAIMGTNSTGKKVMYKRFNVSRCLSPLAAIGAALSVLDRTVEFARTKIVYDRPIGMNQGVSFPLVEHYTRIEAARSLAYQALWLNDQGQMAVKESAMAKWFGITSAIQAIADCLQLHGANGYLTEHPLEQRLRDVLGLQFTGGTINIMKIILVREILGREFGGI